MRDAPRWALVAVVSIAVSSWLLYNLSPPAIANLAIGPYALALVLGPSIVYPVARGGGRSTRAAVGASLVVPALWLLKEGWRVSRVFGPGETAYYALNPLSVGLFVGAAFQVAVWELLLRRLQTGRWSLSGWPVVTLGVVFALAGVFGIVASVSDPKVVFYSYIAVYRGLFPD